MYLHSVSAYADRIFDLLDASSMQALRSMAFEELPALHHTWGRFLRNEYGLWDPAHPLTEHWHAHEEERDMRDNIDYSADHPDAISMAIIRAVWKKANA